MPPSKHRIWVRLTWQQVGALLAVAEAIDIEPEALEDLLPEAGERSAFRGAMTALQKTRDAVEKMG